MESLKKENLRLVGSAPTMQTLIELIETRMYWKVIKTFISDKYKVGRKDTFQIETSKGISECAIIVNDKNRYKLYFIN